MGGRQTNSQVIVSGVPSRRDKKYKGRLIAGYDKRGYPASVVEAGHHRAQQIDRQSAQVAQARYMSSSMWTFALLRDSSDLHIYKDLYGERNKPEKKRKITVELQ